MQQIADWLEKLGMSEYAERFAESDIDTSVLRDLTDQDLKELGVSLGHRRKMLRAIAELADAAPASPQLCPASPLSRPCTCLSSSLHTARNACHYTKIAAALSTGECRR